VLKQNKGFIKTGTSPLPVSCLILVFALVRQFSKIRVVERESFELVLVDCSDEFWIDRGKDWFLLGKLWVEVKHILLVFLEVIEKIFVSITEKRQII